MNDSLKVAWDIINDHIGDPSDKEALAIDIAAAIDAVAHGSSLAPPVEAEPVAWPGRQFCEIAERNVAGLAERLKGADDKRVASDAALAIRTLLTHPPLAAQPPDDVREAVEWHTDFAHAPRDGREVRLWNGRISQRLRWSTHYSIHGLGGCWTDGNCTMSDLDFRSWALSPTPPDDVAEGMVAQAYRDADFLCGAASLNPNTAWEARMLAASELMRKLARTLKSGSGQ